MELKRILAKDARSAMDIAMERYGKDVLVVSSQAVAGQVELVVALDVQPEPPSPPAPVAQPATPSAFTQAFRQALGPMPEPEPEHAKFIQDEPAAVAEVPGAKPDTPAAVAVAVAVATAATSMPAPAVQADAETPVTAAEVTAADEAPLPAATTAAADARAHEAIDLVRREIAALRQEFQLSRQIQASQQPQAWPAEIAPLVAALHDNGVPVGLRALLMDSITQARDASEAARIMRQLMSDALAGLPVVDISRGMHAVCGPSGSGKSSMIARLASAASQRLGAEQVALVVFNDTRSGAWSQMQILAAQAGVACYRAADDKTLRLLIEELGTRQLVLIDTGGSDCMAQASRLQALELGIQTHALLPADGSIGSVRRVLAQDAAWSGVMISKIDECESPWPLLQALSDRQWPVSCASATADLQQPVQSFDAQVLLQAAFERLGVDTPPLAAPRARSVVPRVPSKAKSRAVAAAEPSTALEVAPRSRARARAASAQATA